MSDLKVSNLAVDLLQNQGTIALFKSIPALELGAPHKISAVNINVPLPGAGDQPDQRLKYLAIDEARKILVEAIEALDRYDVR